MTVSSSQRLLGILSITSLVLTSCAIKRDEYNVPIAPLPQQFKNKATFSGSENDATDSNQATGQEFGALLNEWWYTLENEELNRLIDQAMANNTDLRIAMLRISESYARSEQAFADQFPEISAVGQGHHDSPSNGVNSFSGFGNRKDRQYAQIGPKADWRVDIWGELKSLSEGAELEAWGASYQRDNVRRQLVANVVSRYVEYLSLNDRIQVAVETKDALQDLLNSVEERLKLGDATIIELEQQRAAVMAVEATIPSLELQREIAENALTQLVGVTPGSLKLSTQGIDSLKFPNIIPSVPSNLILQRPDVRAVEAQLLAADADIDVARARVLPPLDITAQAGWGLLALGGISTPYGPLFNLAANLSATIFDYGKRMEEVNYSRARHEELIENYIGVIYQAVRETEDALINTHMTGKQLQAQKMATGAALKAWESSQISYDFGDIDFLTLLDTERTYHGNLDTYHRIRKDRYLGLVAVFSALGGGVPPGDSLPGDGRRPDDQKGPSSVTVAAPAAGIQWEEVEDSEEFWLVQLAGLQDPAGVVHVWRDLQQRFPDLMQGHSLMPREEGRIENDEHERIRWYRIFVGSFQDQNAAESFCRELQTQLLRCGALSSDDSRFDGLNAEKPKQIVETRRDPIPSEPNTAAQKPAATQAPVQSDTAEPVPLPSSTEKTMPDTAEQKAFAVQLISVYSQADAEREQSRLKRLGVESYIYPLENSDHKPVYTLRSGIFRTRRAAFRYRKTLKAQLHVDPLPVTIRLDASGQPAPLFASIQEKAPIEP